MSLHRIPFDRSLIIQDAAARFLISAPLFNWIVENCGPGQRFYHGNMFFEDNWWWDWGFEKNWRLKNTPYFNTFDVKSALLFKLTWCGS